MRISEKEEGKKGGGGGEKTRSTVSRESWPEKEAREIKKAHFPRNENHSTGECTRAMDLQIFALQYSRNNSRRLSLRNEDSTNNFR